MNYYTDIVFEILKYVTASSVAIALLFFFAKKYIAIFIENKFDEQLETYKHDLSLITENARFDYQRKIQDFNLYTIKKHERYVEIHKGISKNSTITNRMERNLTSPRIVLRSKTP